jgi:hypothetical protein
MFYIFILYNLFEFKYQRGFHIFPELFEFPLNFESSDSFEFDSNNQMEIRKWYCALGFDLS